MRRNWLDADNVEGVDGREAVRQVAVSGQTYNDLGAADNDLAAALLAKEAKMKFRLNGRRRFLWIFVVGCVIASVLPFVVPKLDPAACSTLVVSVLALVGGLTGFLYGEHSRAAQTFRELFREFNERYDNRNEGLNKIRSRPEGHPLEPGDRDVLFDYFNLCAEEYSYADAGFVDPRVWHAWQNGMRYFAQDPEIRDLWERELEEDFYYGFTLRVLDA